MAIGGLSFMAFWFCVPDPLFEDPFSLMVLDREGKFVGARIATDEQWRFEMTGPVPEKFVKALVAYEDKRFWRHPGVDIRAVARAMASNIRAGKIVSGGSTLTMQLMRMARKNRVRNITQKLIETVQALRAELRYSKKEIIRMYAAHAPFGGNVVGLEAASWRYFGKPAANLSWAEAATLAVLPNSPALIHPGRNRQALREKRDMLLDRMVAEGVLQREAARLAKLEPIPEKPYRLADAAPHFTSLVGKTHSGQVHTTLDLQLQEAVAMIASGYHKVYAQNEVHNMAVIVSDTETGAVLAYFGNTTDDLKSHENDVDMVQAERSSGSILKPLLYIAALEDGMIMPDQLLPDVPTTIAGYKPENFNRAYEGKVKAREALSRSLNVPAVNLLRDYGVERFHRKLIELGFSSIHFSAEHYGLPLILGGAEVTLWDLAGVYASMGRALDHAYAFGHKYASSDLRPLHYLGIDGYDSSPFLQDEPTFFHYGAIWSVFEAMKEVSRPREDGSWEIFRNARQIHWKTGTSYGFRDAWAIGVTPRFTVGVWVGNADGEGRPGIIGVRAAAPVLFDVFRALPATSAFEPPHDALVEKRICRTSGHPAGSFCADADTMLVSDVFMQVDVCPYHQPVLSDTGREFQYSLSCAGQEETIRYGHFTLDPVSAWYYRKVHPEYADPPPFHPACQDKTFGSAGQQVEIAYPPENAGIYLPVDLDQHVNELVCRATASQAADTLYWYLDNDFLGVTSNFHTQKITPAEGDHMLTVVHPSGDRSTRHFQILSAPGRN